VSGGAPLLEVRDLTVTFGARPPAVRDVSFELAPAQRLGLIGESGSGKSLTALAVLGLLPDDASLAGSIRLSGRELVGLPERQLARVRGQQVAMVFQEPMTALDPTMKVGRQVAEVVRLHRRGAGPGEPAPPTRERVLEVLALVDLPDPARLAERYPHQLSGGQRQRVVLAMALVNSPDLLLCDEPTTALDVTVQAQIMKLLSEIRQDLGTAVILITHDLGVVAGFCDRTLVMYGGQIMEEGGTDAIFATPTHPYTLGLLSAVPRIDRMDEALLTIAGEPPDMSRLPPGCPFFPRCAFALPQNERLRPPLVTLPDGRRRACHVPVEEILARREAAQ
jgi:oligopeptide transport system ATP-binding protein